MRGLYWMEWYVGFFVAEKATKYHETHRVLRGLQLYLP